MSKAGEIRLCKEFENLQVLQQDSRTDGIINIEYNPRNSGDPNKWVPIMVNPKDGLYPYRFRLTYTMPMYVGPGQLERNWHQSFIFEAPEEVLMDPHSNINVSVEGGFTCGVPFNNHCSAAWLCSGSAWGASRGMGIWYFVLCIGCLLNQERFLMADEPHLNANALTWWKEQRQMRPNNDIQWPFDLLDKAMKYKIHFGDTSTPKPSSVGFTFGVSKQPKISFGSKY